MQPEEELRADHMAIRSGLNLLEELTGGLREGHPVRNTDLYTLVDVIDQAVVDEHHAKEEQVLFDFLRERRERFGFDGLRAFETDHDAFDESLAELRELVDRASGGDKRARQRIHKRAQQLGESAREHMKREEELFVDRLHENLTTDEIRELDRRLSDFDGETRARSRLDDRVQRLAETYEDRW